MRSGGGGDKRVNGVGIVSKTKLRKKEEELEWKGEDLDRLFAAQFFFLENEKIKRFILLSHPKEEYGFGLFKPYLYCKADVKLYS